ncbi:gag/pol protein [Cucumis melo var. makuwa]|uniref:Gag/pol protein n=1 Tax=Cucumis melo var. makuwa TaxID=1194695 RepID=A0A5D3DX49_CUCMM|nr:gag/pol protein [Cucumis melo var. makuwa]
MPRCSGRIVSQPNCYLGLTKTQVVIADDGVENPLSYKQTMKDADKDQWVKAMDLEMESMHFNSVWGLIDLPEMMQPIGHEVHLSKEKCPKTPQGVEDGRHIPMPQFNKDSMKSMSRSVFTKNEEVVIWLSIKQGCIANCTMKVEYVAACEAAKETVWLRKFLHDLKVVPNMNTSITLYYDNIVTIANTNEGNT